MARNFKLTEKQFRIWKKAMEIGKKVFRCHQLPERSFFFHGMQFPVCARCTGILVGFYMLGPLITFFTFGYMALSLSLIVIMIFDGTLQYCTRYVSNNIIRLITGLGFGYSGFSIINHIIIKIMSLI